MRAKRIGGILLIVGSAIGGGILALPIATAELGFVNSSILLFFCWAMMTASALLVLEIALWLPKNTNIISMARATLGKPGAAVAWVVYLSLLYLLLAAYIAGGSDVFKNLLEIIHVTLPTSAVASLFTVILGYVVYLGIHAVDHVNRGLMTIKLATFFLLVALVSTHVSWPNLAGGQFVFFSAGLTVVITSFGFAPIIPSLRYYFNDDVKTIRQIVIIGSFIPLICYILWDMTVMGVISREGKDGLISMLHSGQSTSAFVNQLSVLIHQETIITLAHLFVSICLLTSFLVVSLGMVDFLSDGLRVEKSGKKNLIMCAAALLPPLFIVIIDPRIFIAALSYAGIDCIILLIILPVLMIWRGRYYLNMAGQYQVYGGKTLLVGLLIASALMIGQTIISIVITSWK